MRTANLALKIFQGIDIIAVVKQAEFGEVGIARRAALLGEGEDAETTGRCRRLPRKAEGVPFDRDGSHCRKLDGSAAAVGRISGSVIHDHFPPLEKRLSAAPQPRHDRMHPIIIVRSLQFRDSIRLIFSRIASENRNALIAVVEQ